MNKKEKRATFRQLAQATGIKTGKKFAEDRQQPCLDFDAKPARRRDVPGHLLIDDVVVADMNALQERSRLEREAAERRGPLKLARWGRVRPQRCV